MTSGSTPVGRFQTLLTDQLADERAKKTSLEQRGLAVISTSGVLVAITFGFRALDSQERLRPAAMGLLLAAFVFLVAASITGLAVNVPARLPVLDADELVRLSLQADWNVTDTGSAQEEYRHWALLLAGTRRVNRVRARALVAALAMEIIAITLMACGLAVTIWPRTAS